MDHKTARIDTFLEERLDRYIGETARLCAQPSISPTGEGVLECAELVREVLQAHGLQVNWFETPGYPVLVAHADGESSRRLLFYNHYDVQPPDPLELWQTPPFEPTIRDGVLYARGAQDDKGQLVARLAAVDAARDANRGSLPCGVTFVIEGEEEQGSPHIADFVRQHIDQLSCDGTIWENGGVDAEGCPGTILGVLGVLAVEVSLRTLKSDAHSGRAHKLPNAAWRLNRMLTTLRDADGTVRIAGFYDSARPPSEADLRLLDALPDTEASDRETYGVKEFVGGMTGDQLKRSIFSPTCNVAGITAGYQGEGMKTVIPANAKVKIDFRLVPDQDPQDILTKLRAHLDTQGFGDAHVTPLGGMMWPYKASADDPLVSLAASTGEAVYQKKYRLTPLLSGSSPIYAFAGPLGGIPVISAGVGYKGSLNHAPNENVRLDDFLKASRHIARIVLGFADIWK